MWRGLWTNLHVEKIKECSTALQNIWDVRNKVYVNSYFHGTNSLVIWLYCVWGHGESKHHSRKDATKKNFMRHPLKVMLTKLKKFHHSLIVPLSVDQAFSTHNFTKSLGWNYNTSVVDMNPLKSFGWHKDKLKLFLKGKKIWWWLVNVRVERLHTTNHWEPFSELRKITS